MTESYQRTRKNQLFTNDRKNGSHGKVKAKSQENDERTVFFPCAPRICVVRKDADGNKQLVYLTRQQFLESN